MELKQETSEHHLNHSRMVMDFAKPEEIEDIFQFVMKHHFAVPPLRQIMFFDDFADSKSADYCFANIQRLLLQPYSVVIKDFEASGNRIIGVSLNLLEDRHGSPMLNGPHPNDRSAGWLTRAIVAELYRDVDLFARFETDKILDFSLGVVDPIYRRSGLISRMLSLIVDVAQQETGVCVVKGHALREGGFRYLAQTLGLQVIRTVEYATFEHPPGVKVMADMNGLGESRFARLTGQLPLPASNSL